MAISPDTPVPAGRRPGTEPDWLVEAYRAHAGELRGFAARALQDDALAEDAVQETFVRAWRFRRRFDAKRGSLRSWLFAIERNVIADAGRSRAKAATPSDAEAEGSDSLERQLLTWQVEEALRRIGEDHRRALLEVKLRGRGYDEVAAELGIPVGTLKSRVYYGLRALRNVLQEMGLHE